MRSDHRTFLIPASRVHYAVCEEVVRPKDQMAAMAGEVPLGV